MAAKPNPDLDERVTIPLDPETALSGLMKVGPDTLNGEELARKHGVQPKPLRDMLRRNQSELAPGHELNDHYRIDAETEGRIVAHPEFQTLSKQ